MRTYGSCTLCNFASEIIKHYIMLYLCFNSITRKISIESNASSDLIILISPLVLDKKKKNTKYDIVVPGTNFRVKMHLHYAPSSLSKFVISDNGRDFYWMGALVHSQHLSSRNISIYKERLNEVLVNIKNEEDEDGWRNFYNVVIDLYNNRSTWQVNETSKMINDLKMLFAANGTFVVNSHNGTKEFENSELEHLKINKIYSAIVLFQKCCMTNLYDAKESIYSLAEKAIPLLKKVYFEKLEEIDVLSPLYTNARDTHEKYIDARKHQLDYVDFMLKNKFSQTKENAKAKFKRKYSKESLLLERFDETGFYKLCGKWDRINNKKQIVEEGYKCIFDFMLQEGKFKEYLIATSTVI